MTVSRGLVLVALRGVPRHLRDSVHGDLLEQSASARDALAVVLHFQAEPYRAGTDRRCTVLLLLAAAALLWAVPMAAQGVLADAAVFDDAFSRTALRLWATPHVLGALACGLLIGGAPWLPGHTDAARAHGVLLLTAAAGFAAPTALQALLSAAVLPAAAWLSYQNRHATSEGPEST